MEIEAITYWVAYFVALIIMFAVAYRFKQHSGEPETFLAMIVPMVIPIAQQTFAGDRSTDHHPEFSLLLMVVALSSSYFLGSVLALTVEEKEDFWPHYVSFIVWGAGYGGLTVGARLQEVTGSGIAPFGVVFGLGVMLPMLAVAYTAGALSGAADMRFRVLRFIIICSGAIGAAMHIGFRFG